MRLKPLTVGPIVGKTTASSVRLWGRGDGAMGRDGRPQRCFGVARIAKPGGRFQKPALFKMRPHFDYTGIVDFADLAPDTSYRYQMGYFNAELEAEAIATSARDDGAWADVDSGQFTTASSSEAGVSFVFGSCRYLLRMFGGIFFDERGDKTFRSITQQARDGRKTDFVLMVGDQIYADDLNRFGADDSLDEFNRRYRVSFTQPHIREMMSRIPTYMILDDHEIEDNWSQDRWHSRYNLYVAAMQSYHSYQLVHGPAFAPSGVSEATDTPERLWYDYQVGAAKVFVMDTRTERFLKPDSLKRMVGPEQMDALKAWLSRDGSDDSAKFVVSSVPMFPEFLPDPEDKWTEYREQRFEILEHIRKEKVERVVFLGGDVHCSLAAQLTHEDDPDFKVTSIISSSFFWPYPQGRRSDFALEGPLDPLAGKYRVTNASDVFSTDNFVRVSYDPDAARDRLRVEMFGRKGASLEETTIEI